ncbi:helix-turn-helix domain-containing protein [Roseateles chitinivorans]|uniref:helix-turn-helix domain-containing protein n=2 Tax=Roseateles TaxID=93681 RepID=UPI003D67CA44
MAHPWPGNVRELKNVIERAALLAPGRVIGEQDLALPALSTLATPLASRNLDEPSREAVVAALESASGVISRAAQSLGLSRQALYRRMERYGLDVG